MTTKGVRVVAEGLRERKKQQTRERIARAAMELFERDGFHETTIPAIAAAADVSPRTVSSYFPAKEDLVFPELVEPGGGFSALATMLDERGEGVSTADALRAWLREQLPEWAARHEQTRAQRRIVASDPALQAYERRFQAEAEAMVAAAIAGDLGASPGDLEPRMAAAAMFAMFGVLGDEKRDVVDCEGREAPVGHDVTEEGIRLLDRTLRFVDAGIRSMRDGGDAPGA